jgi:hypothetical protein
MTTYWTRARWVSLGVHAGIVTIPFTISAVSAFLFWQRLFNSALLAGVMVSVVDILALLGLILFIAGITSPFQALRHLLPFVSILPLGLELYTLLAHNGMAVSVVVSVVVTAILVTIAWQCFRTIEALFIDPVAAAREQAHAQLRGLLVAQAQLTQIRDVSESFAREWARPALVSAPTDTALTPPDTAPPVVSANDTATPRRSLTMARVAAMAQARGVSERTIWRKVRAGELTIDESEAS